MTQAVPLRILIVLVIKDQRWQRLGARQCPDNA